MFSLLLELKTDCNFCGNPLPINAFVDKIFCDKCNKDNVLNAELWKSLLEELPDDILGFKDDEGRPSKVMTGQYNFDMMYGRKQARCNKCKTDIPDDELNKFTEGGNYKCKKCGANVFVRPANDLMKSIFPSSKYIVSEDENMLKGTPEKPADTNSDKPVLFTCPSCAGNLEIDGKERIVECNFCKSKVYLPDDLWFSLHPVVSKERWYITFDSKLLSEQLPEWCKLYDAAIDREGNIYVAGTLDVFDKDVTVWSFSPDFKKRWSVNNLNVEDVHTHLAVTKKGELYLWDSTKHSISVLSCKDGALLRKINGSEQSKDNHYPFTVKDCETLINDSDDTILAVINDLFVRFNTDGTRASLWGDPADKGSIGLFSAFFSGFDHKINLSEGYSGDIPELKELGDKPRAVKSYKVEMFAGWDDYIYIYNLEYSVAYIAKYTRRGKQEWSTSFQFDELCDKIYADGKGNVYIAGTDGNKKSKIMRYTPDTDNFDVVLKDISEGGTYVFDSCDMVLVSPEGVINIINTSGDLRVYNPDYSVKYISKSIKEDDESYREELNRNN